MPETFSIPQKVRRPKPRVPNDGRPTKQTPELVKKICDAMATGLNDEESALVANIAIETFRTWKRDPAFVEKIKRAVALRLYKRLQKIEAGADRWQGTGWVLERLYATRFAKPEIQLSFNNNAVTQNYLSISISAQQAREIEAEAAPIRESVAAMIAKYRPQSQGNGEKVCDIEAQSVVEQPTETVVITHREGDEKRESFWRTLVSGDPEKVLIAQATAVFVCRIILGEALGSRSAGMRLEFSEDPVRLSDVLGAIDRLCEGPAGWQAMQKRAGF